VRADLEFHHVYEFLSRLRKEFEPRCAQLFARGRVSLLEALSEIRAEETRLRGVGLLEVPYVLVARAPATPCASGGEGRPRAHLHCGYCEKDGHPESDCFKKQRHMRNMEHSSSVTPSAVTFTEQNILKLKRLLAASGSLSIGSAGLVADSSLERPLSSHSDAQTWELWLVMALASIIVMSFPSRVSFLYDVFLVFYFCCVHQIHYLFCVSYVIRVHYTFIVSLFLSPWFFMDFRGLFCVVDLRPLSLSSSLFC
jgi:hypothetical protein